MNKIGHGEGVAIKLRRLLDAYEGHVAVIDAELRVIYVNRTLADCLVSNGVPLPNVLGNRYGKAFPEYTPQARYILATLYQGLEEVVTGLLPVFCRDCRLDSSTGTLFFRLTASPCLLLDDSRGAVLWHDDLGSAGQLAGFFIYTE